MIGRLIIYRTVYYIQVPGLDKLFSASNYITERAEKQEGNFLTERGAEGLQKARIRTGSCRGAGGLILIATTGWAPQAGAERGDNSGLAFKQVQKGAERKNFSIFGAKKSAERAFLLKKFFEFFCRIREILKRPLLPNCNFMLLSRNYGPAVRALQAG